MQVKRYSTIERKRFETLSDQEIGEGFAFEQKQQEIFRTIDRRLWFSY
jgi:hypothetical protein